MKKSLLFIICGVLLLTGCDKTTTCTLKTEEDAYKTDSEYRVTYNDKKQVVKIHTEQTVISDDESILDVLEEQVKNQYGPYKNVNYYDISVKRKKGVLEIKINANYKKINVNDLISIDSSNESLFKNGKLSYDTILSTYKLIGATCKEK